MREMAELEALEMASFEAEAAEAEARTTADQVSQVMGIQLPKELQITVVTKAQQKRKAAADEVREVRESAETRPVKDGKSGKAAKKVAPDEAGAEAADLTKPSSHKSKEGGGSKSSSKHKSDKSSRRRTSSESSRSNSPSVFKKKKERQHKREEGASAAPKKGESFYSFEVDESLHIRTGEDGRPKFVCDICQTTYQRLHSLKRHYYRNHINHKYVHESDMASAELTALQDTSGFREATERAAGSRRPFLYCCYLCRTLYDSLAAVVEHTTATHSGKARDAAPGKRLECDKCDETFAGRRELEKHREVHQCHTFACKFCDQVFPCESVKKRHEKIHNREARPPEAGAQQTIAKINIGGVKISVGIGNLQQLKKFKEACKEMSETSNGAISLESADLEALERSTQWWRVHKEQDEAELERQRAADEARFYAGVCVNVADNLTNYMDGTEDPAELTGEWERLMCFVCHACGAVFGSLYELDEHKAYRHPHVLCGHTSLPDDLELLSEAVFGQYVSGASAERDNLEFPVGCGRCDRNCNSLPELHRHILECAGDADWNTWSTPRKRNRRGMKRILATPSRPKREKPPKPKQSRDTSADSIEKMLANLPAKRVSKQLFPMLNLVQLQKRAPAP
ncbi:zinc finger protein 646-like [Pollicipes pollicipes]|uniref:zinc finger protein 646-like n=1 Tax=Pollicipes pollicipes TaxID=41117 RepID=UPI001884B6D2|nr:zinc finger protein 646-like [Pollicipes pollicipes]